MARPKPARRALPVVTRLATANAPSDAPAKDPNPVKVAPPRHALRPLKPSSDAPAQADAAPSPVRPPKHLVVASLDAPAKKVKLRPLKTAPAWIAINDTPQPGASHSNGRN